VLGNRRSRVPGLDKAVFSSGSHSVPELHQQSRCTFGPLFKSAAGAELVPSLMHAPPEHCVFTDQSQSDGIFERACAGKRSALGTALGTPSTRRTGTLRTSYAWASTRHPDRRRCWRTKGICASGVRPCPAVRRVPWPPPAQGWCASADGADGPGIEQLPDLEEARVVADVLPDHEQASGTIGSSDQRPPAGRYVRFSESNLDAYTEARRVNAIR
jgi:hypothetical protein